MFYQPAPSTKSPLTAMLRKEGTSKFELEIPGGIIEKENSIDVSNIAFNISWSLYRL